MVGAGRGAQLGLLIKGPEILESTRRIDTIVLDKTGTVTTGKMALVEVVAADGIDRDEALRLAGALEDGSEHPIAQAIVAAAREAGALRTVETFANHEGSASPASSTATRSWSGARPCSPTGRCTYPPSSTARAVAAEVGIDEVIAEVLPSQKADVVRGLQAAGRVVAMAGDGSTTHPRSPRPTSASRSVPAPTSPSRPPTSRSSAATFAPPPPRSGSRGRPCARSDRTSAGRSATTSPLCRWRRSASSTR